MELVKIRRIVKWLSDFPRKDENYSVCETEDGRYAFVWGWQYPDALNQIPAIDIPDGENGVRYFPAKEKAINAFKETANAVISVEGGHLEEENQIVLRYIPPIPAND